VLVPFSSKYFVFLSHNTVMCNGSSFDKPFPVLSYFSCNSSTLLYIVPYMVLPLYLASPKKFIQCQILVSQRYCNNIHTYYCGLNSSPSLVQSCTAQPRFGRRAAYTTVVPQDYIIILNIVLQLPTVFSPVTWSKGL